jgi:DNA-directed RNA polymerase sigma subunit (sigma70/sigma32)
MAGILDYDVISEAVNTKKPGQKKPGLKTTPAEIAGLMAAASTVSMDAPLTDDDEAGHVSDRFAAPASTQPDVQVEKAEAMSAMQQALKTLTVFERKLLRLRGMSI